MILYCKPPSTSPSPPKKSSERWEGYKCDTTCGLLTNYTPQFQAHLTSNFAFSIAFATCPTVPGTKPPPLPAGTCILIFLKKGFVQSAANREQKGWSRPRGRVPLWFYLGLIPMTLFKATPEPQIIGFCKVLWGQHGVILHETDPFRLSLSIVWAFKMKLNGLKSCPTLIRGADERNLFYVESSFSVSPLFVQFRAR